MVAAKTRVRPRPLYVALAPDVREQLDALVADAGAARGRNASIVEVVAQLVKNQTKRKVPLSLER